jgi:hypothetical protein
MAKADADRSIAPRGIGTPQEQVAQVIPAARREQEAFPIWTTVREQVVHSLEYVRIHGAIRSDDSHDSAHALIAKGRGRDQRLIAAIFPWASQAPARKSRAHRP